KILYHRLHHPHPLHHLFPPGFPLQPRLPIPPPTTLSVISQTQPGSISDTHRSSHSTNASETDSLDRSSSPSQMDKDLLEEPLGVYHQDLMMA
ncbi:unnamed protein product, partial [Rotaria socialis]